MFEFLDIRTMECLLRKYDVKPIKFPEPNFGKTEVSRNVCVLL